MVSLTSLTLAHGQVEVGDRYLSGDKGAEKNASEAVWWYTMAAYQGLPAGQARDQRSSHI